MSQKEIYLGPPAFVSASEPGNPGEYTAVDQALGFGVLEHQIIDVSSEEHVLQGGSEGSGSTTDAAVLDEV